MAKAVLKRHKPLLVGVTGSVGKSSTKEAIALVLRLKFNVRKNEENYNNEIGIPLTIIGAKSGKSSLMGWVRVFLQWIHTMVFEYSYPDIVVLELGIDHPGDMKYLLSFLPIEVGVMTNVSGSHLEFFQTIGRIAQEKGLLLKHLPVTGTAVVCADDNRVMKVASKTKAKIVSFGFGESSMVRAEHVSFSGDQNHSGGCHFKVSFDGKTVPIHLPHIVATHHIQAVLAGICVGMAFKINPMEMVSGVREFVSLPGRMRLLDGLNETSLIDDTYNASLVSLHAALVTLHSFQNRRRVAILGDMLELGDNSVAAHCEIAEWIYTYDVQKIILVGKRMHDTYDTLLKKGFSQEKCHWFASPQDAASTVSSSIVQGDAILIKGSQGMRMEIITKLLLAHPEHAETLLCRQSPEWKRKQFLAQ